MKRSEPFAIIHMTHITRSLQLLDIIKRKSSFLLGPRQTGKSTLIKKQLSDAKVYNLLETNTYRSLANNPSLLSEPPPEKWTPHLT